MKTIGLKLSENKLYPSISGFSRINIKTADDHPGAGSNGNLYLEVCDTNDSNSCCKQTFDGNFEEVGAENIFAFNAEFQKCLESSQKLYYFMGIITGPDTGPDGWKSDVIKIYFDGLTEEVCTLDGGKWLDGPGEVGQTRRPLKCQGWS